MAAKILVIEDERSVLQNTLEMLTLEGFDVRGAENGCDGVARAREYQPDLIICDIMMPKMDGYEVLAELREQPLTALIPFIFLTARTDRRDVRQGMNLGADDYLTKPFTVAELLGSVHARLKMSSSIHRMTEERLDRLRSSILLTIPHELRTPLTSVLGFSEMIVTEGHDMEAEQMIRMARHIYTAAVRLSRLVENHLIYAQTEIIQLDAQRAKTLAGGTCQAQAAVQEAVQEVALRASRSPDLTLEVAAAELAIQEEYLRKMVSELVDNACKFSAESSPVTVRGAVSDQTYCLEVIDQGRGMSAQDIAQIGAYSQFERQFYEHQGSGLGLIIVRRLAEIHEGRLEIISEPGQGTKARLSLPLAGQRVTLT